MTTSISASTNYTLGAGEDNLLLTGSADLKGTGNNANNQLEGNDGANVLIGGLGYDQLYAGAGDDVLIGNQAGVMQDNDADALFGHQGNDTLYLNGLDYADGDEGADTYWVTGGSNSIQDNGPDAGVDVVKAFTSVSMPGYYAVQDPRYGNVSAYGIERVELQGDANLSAMGGDGAQVLIGNSGNNLLDGGNTGMDTLDGGAGNDTLRVSGGWEQPGAVLTGGAGQDVFYFLGALSGDHSQGDTTVRITDFTQGEDVIGLNLLAGVAAPSSLITLTAQTGDTLDSLLSQAASQANVSQPSALSQFEFAGDTYVVLDNNEMSNEVTLADLAFKLDGAHALTLADFAITANTRQNIGGAGADVIRVAGYSHGQQTVTLTGNGGNDVFWIQSSYRGDHATGSNTLTLSDFTPGADTLVLGLGNTALIKPDHITTLTVEAGDTLATLMARASHQTTTYTQPALSQFVWGGDTYLVMDTTADPTWVSSNLAIKLSGAPTLSMADISFAG